MSKKAINNNMKTTTETVTPAMAAEYLSKNHPKNRPIRDFRVKKWVEEIKQGRWLLTHQGIAFDEDGYLIDGQHRLTAVITSGIPAPMMVTKGVDVSTFAVLDQGAMRSASDILGLSSRQVAALRCLMGLEGYDLNFAHLSASDLEERYAKGIPDLDHMLQTVKINRSSSSFFTAAVFAALAYAYPVAPQTVEDFAEQVRSGELIARTDPAYRFREWMTNKARARSPWEVAMATLQAFQHLLLEGNQKISSLHSGESGYRVITTQRRVRRVPETPTAKAVLTMSPNIDQAKLK